MRLARVGRPPWTSRSTAAPWEGTRLRHARLEQDLNSITYYGKARLLPLRGGISTKLMLPRREIVAQNEGLFMHKRVSKKCFGLNSTDHEMDHRDVNHSLTTCHEVFVVFTQATVFPQPAEGPI